MNDEQNREYNAASTGVAVMDNHLADFSGDLALKAKKTEIENKLDDIDLAKVKQQASTHGATTSKGTIFKKMMTSSWIIARLLVAYGKQINNTNLIADMDKPRSSFVHTDFVNGKTLADKVFAAGGTHQVAALAAGFQLTALMVSGLGTLITDFVAAKDQPEAIKSDVQAAGILVATEIKDLKTLVKDLFGDLMPGYAESNTPFYNAVNDGFQVNDAGVRHIAIRVAVNDSVVLVRLPKAVVTVVELTKAKNSSVRGISDFSQQDIAPGNYTVKIELPGYATQTIQNVKVVDGVMTTVNVVLVKI